MGSSQALCMSAASTLCPLFLEKKLISKYRCFNTPKPKVTKIVDTADFGAAVSGKYILVNKEFLQKSPSQKELEDLLKHGLIHCLYPKYGHSIEFLNLSTKLKASTGDYELCRLIEELNKTALEGRISSHLNEKGEEIVKIRRKPSRTGFKELLEIYCLRAGETPKILRRRCGISRKELAKEVAISQHQLKRVEDGKDSDWNIHTNKDVLEKYSGRF